MLYLHIFFIQFNSINIYILFYYRNNYIKTKKKKNLLLMYIFYHINLILYY